MCGYHLKKMLKSQRGNKKIHRFGPKNDNILTKKINKLFHRTGLETYIETVRERGMSNTKLQSKKLRA
jgi:hypothetical protein